MNNIPKVYEENEPFIFISYAHKDSERVYEFINRLVVDGYRVWFDDGIHASEDFAVKIADRIVESAFFISMVSDNFLASEWCLDELAFAKSEKQPSERFLIYMDNIELPRSLKLQHNRIQNLKMWELGDRLYQKIYAVKEFDLCKDKFGASTKEYIPGTNKIEKEVIKRRHLKVGDKLLFGRYPQTSDGTVEEISWKVLALEENKALLISEYGLDSQPYNTERTDVVWENCSLRSWMNSTFFSKAFTTEEAEKICKTTAVEDKLFLLSIDEAAKFFKNNEERMCVPTEYAIANGAYTGSHGEGTSWWWLRSPGDLSNSAAYVLTNGALLRIGITVNIERVCVRPAMWINLE